ncbi:PEP/pyruvate-binding domain-containing protein, partial [Planctomycetota bacterium]
MAIEINQLLQFVVKHNSSDLHLCVGRPPTVRLHGRLMKLDTAVLTPDDTQAFMKAITPDRHQQELAEVGTSDFGFAFADQARFRVSVYKQLDKIQRRLEKHYKDMQDLEFTIQEGRLWLLQTRTGKRNGPAAVRMAAEMFRSKLIDAKTAVLRVTPDQL